jgi:EmrB/QacA subfamily drug resistance transporter
VEANLGRQLGIAAGDDPLGHQRIPAGARAAAAAERLAGGRYQAPFSSSWFGLHPLGGGTLPKIKNQSFPDTGATSGVFIDLPKRTSHPNLILAICCLSVLILSMDVTIVNVALPTIQRELHAGLAGLQWLLDAYTLVVASFLMLSGSISDRFGRRRVFLTGLSIFTFASLLCSQAATIEQLIGFRVLQGLGASMLNPVALSIIANAFPQPKARAWAVGVWGAVAGLSLGIGPVIGGALTEATGWRSIFWINVPIGVAAALLAARFVPESKAARTRAFDPVGQALVLIGLSTLTCGVIEGPHAGWRSAMILGLFLTAAAALVAFVLYEPRRRDPLLDLRFFHSVSFSTATLLGLSSFSCFAGFLFLSALYLQQVRGFSAFHTGLFTVPLAIMMIVCAPSSGRLVGNYGTQPSLLAAGGGFMLSSLMLTRLAPHTSIGWLLAVYALFGVGLGMVNPAISNSAVAGMPLSQAGVAAAIASTSRQVGAAIGIAVSGTVVAVSHARGTDFTTATHAIWWVMTGCGAAVLVLGFASNTAWARESTEQVAHLLEERR